MLDEEASAQKLRAAQDFETMGRIFILLCVAVVIAIVIASISSHLFVSLSTIGISLVVMMSSGLVGGLIGFIFSVPYLNKVIVPEPPEAKKGTVEKPLLEQRQPLLRSNSNLEKISEWLTTMLVGVGLSQINNIFQGLKKFGALLAPSDTIQVGDVATQVGRLQYIGPCVLMAGMALGFLSVYLYTRLRISYLFYNVEKELVGDSAADAKLSSSEAGKIRSIAASTGLEASPSYKVMKAAGFPSVREALSMMTELLYEVESKGYLDAIRIGNELYETPAITTARFWFLMTAAYGQKYKAEKANSETDSVLSKTRESVLYSIDKTE